jgi:hypothetical protein
MRTIQRTVTAIRQDIRQSKEVIHLRHQRIGALNDLKAKAELINNVAQVLFLLNEIASFEKLIADEQKRIDELECEAKEPRRSR